MDDLVERLEAAADVLTAVHRGVPEVRVGAADFGADISGRPGRIARELHAQWHAALESRAAEAAVAAERLAELASSVRGVARRYAETDDSVATRFTGYDLRRGA